MNRHMKRQLRRISKDNHGIAAIEFALTLPIQVAMLIGVLEFGSYMLNAQMASRSIANLSHAIASDPRNPNLMEMARMQGLAVAETNVALNSNYVCAQSYSTLDEAKNGSCDGTKWTTTRPESESNPTQAYYVALGTHIQNSSLTGLFDGLIPNIEYREVILVSAEDENAGKTPDMGNPPQPPTENFPDVISTHHVPASQLRDLHPVCQSYDAAMECNSAAFRHCRNIGYESGFLNELNLWGNAIITCLGVQQYVAPTAPTPPPTPTQPTEDYTGADGGWVPAPPTPTQPTEETYNPPTCAGQGC